VSFVEQELTQEQWLRSIWNALTRMEELLSQPVRVPPIEIPPPPEVDYDRLTASIVGMLSQLHPTGPTAEEIASAIRLIFPPTTEEVPQQGAEALEKVARALEKLEHRMQGLGQSFGAGPGSVGINNWHEMPTATGPEVQRVMDDYQGGEHLADQAGANGVLTFAFTAPVHMVVLESVGATSRADPFGGTPTADRGVALRDGVPMYLPVQTGTVRVWSPTGATVACFGLRRA